MKYKFFSRGAVDKIIVVQNLKFNSAYITWGKRALDISSSLFALPFIVIICAVLWIFNLGSNQKLIFAQPRVGKNGKLFNCFKFQTMVNDAETVLADLCNSDPTAKAEWDEFQKLKDDPRITKMGRIIRKTSIDELPQFFNVLIGDMSIVGPRPFMASQTKMYVDGGGSDYFAMKPGITGNWQVEGRGKTSFLSRVPYDRLYFQKQSLKEDVRLIVKTVKVVARLSGN